MPQTACLLTGLILQCFSHNASKKRWKLFSKLFNDYNTCESMSTEAPRRDLFIYFFFYEMTLFIRKVRQRKEEDILLYTNSMLYRKNEQVL